MIATPPHRAAFTLIELLVVISIIGILAALALPAITGALARGQMTQTLSNCKQLHLATIQMALDANTSGDSNLGWPGDVGAAPGDWAVWATNLVGGGYVSSNDFRKLISAPGVTPSSSDPANPGRSGVKVYGISESSDGATVFISSQNFTNSTNGGTTILSTAKPYGRKGFVVFRKAGDGAILQARQVGSAYTNIIGSFATSVINNPGT